MPKSNYVYESGEAIAVGSHGEHSYLYQSGDPVPDSGVSSVVFESGTGLGGKYLVDGNPYSHSTSSKSVSNWYNYSNSRCEGVPANNGWLIDQTTIVHIWEDGSGNPYLAIIHDLYTQDSCSVDTACDMSFSSPSNSSGFPDGTSAVLGDDSYEDAYTSADTAEWTLSESKADWGTKCRTDGAVYAMPSGSWSVDITHSPNTSRQSNTMDDFGTVDANGNFVSYGAGATITVEKV